MQAARDQAIERPGDRPVWPGPTWRKVATILDESGLALIQADDLDDAAAKAVHAASEEGVPA